MSTVQRRANCTSLCLLRQLISLASATGRFSALCLSGRHVQTRFAAELPLTALALKENAHVLRQEHVLIQDDLAAGDLPCAVDLPQDILPCTDVKVLFRL
jgi:hypothetical protein